LDIEDAFFAQLHPVLTSKGMKVAAAVFKGLLKSAIKIDLGAIDHAKLTTEGKLPEFGLPDFLKNTSGRVLIFDDVERTEMPLKKLLGYINTFVEQDDTRVILIANESEIDIHQQEIYRRTKEKLIGKTFEVEPDFPAAVDEFIDAISDADVKKFFVTQREALETLFQQSKTDNLRILQQAMWDFERLALRMQEAHRKNFDALGAVFGPFLALTFEVRAGRWTLEDMEELSPGTFLRYLAAQKSEKTKRTELAERYPEIRFDDPLIGLDVLGDALFRSALDSEKIQSRVAASRFFTKAADIPAWRRLWHHFSLSDDEADVALNEMEDKFRSRRYTDPGEMLHVFGLRLEMSDVGLLSLSKNEILRENIAYIDDLYALKKLPPKEVSARDYDDVGRHSGGLGYYQKESPEFSTVASYLSEKRDQALVDSYPELARGLLREMVSQPDLFYRRLNLTNSADNTYFNVPILKYLPPSEFVEQIRPLDKETINLAMSAFRKRYEFVTQFSALVVELDWLDEVGRLLAEDAKRRRPLGRRDLENIIQISVTEPLQRARAALAEVSTESSGSGGPLDGMD
jgi:hypothetical protein